MINFVFLIIIIIIIRRIKYFCVYSKKENSNVAEIRYILLFTFIQHSVPYSFPSITSKPTSNEEMIDIPRKVVGLNFCFKIETKFSNLPSWKKYISRPVQSPLIIKIHIWFVNCYMTFEKINFSVAGEWTICSYDD